MNIIILLNNVSCITVVLIQSPFSTTYDVRVCISLCSLVIGQYLRYNEYADKVYTLRVTVH